MPHTKDSEYLSLLHIAKEEGVRDLPMAQRGPFAQAIRAERLAYHAAGGPADRVQLIEKRDAAMVKALKAAKVV